MRRALLIAALLLSAAGLVFLQTPAAVPKLAALMPSGPLLYLESPNLSSLLHEWDSSRVKAIWLGSTNYEVFSHSNLFMKLHDVWGEYGAAAAFRPTFSSALEIAGTDSALALYDIHDVQFLYVTHIGDADVAKTQLWAVRDKFEQRQAGGVQFYVRADPQSKRVVAFALAKGYLLLATRDDLVAQALALLAGGSNPSLASDRWYQESLAHAQRNPELRLVMNLQALVKSSYFRSYWIQRNVSEVRRYWAGLADIHRTAGAITEDRVFLRVPDSQPANQDVSNLLAWVPSEAGFYRAARVTDTSAPAAMIVEKLIASQVRGAADWRAAPMAVSPDVHAGSEADLETRIDEAPLPPDDGIADSVAAVSGMIDRNGCRAALLVQSSASTAFVRLHSAIVLESAQDWNIDAIRQALAVAAGKLWTTSQLGATWASGAAGQHRVEQLDGLGKLIVATQGRLLFVANDPGLLTAVLDRSGFRAPSGPVSYAAGFRHSLERARYEQVMTALDSMSSGVQTFQDMNQPAFFSANLGSLSRALSHISEMRITAEEEDGLTRQTVVYQTPQ